MKLTRSILAVIICLGAAALGRPARADEPARERDDLLETSVGYWEEQNYELASQGLTRVILRNNDKLAELSEEVERRLDMSLAELAAESRLRAARLASTDGALHLRHVTRYEREALSAKLKLAYDHALTEPVSLPAPSSQAAPHPPATVSTTQPAAPPPTLPHPVTPGHARDAEPGAPRVDILQAWLDRLDAGPEPGDESRRPRKEAEGHLRHAIQTLSPETENPSKQKIMITYNGSREEAHFFAQHIRYAESLLRERLRYDPSLREAPEAYKNIRRELGRLDSALAAVDARAGGALSREEAEHLQFERQRMMLNYHARLQRQAMIDQMLIEQSLNQAGEKPGTVRTQSIEIEGGVVTQHGPGGAKRKLDARVVPAIPPEMLREGSNAPGSTSPTATQPANADSAGGQGTP